MSRDRLKTVYAEEAAYGSTDYKTLYCLYNHSCDVTTFYEEDGSVAAMCFGEWESGNDKWDAMQRLWNPFVDKWGGELKEGVEYWDGEFKKKEDTSVSELTFEVIEVKVAGLNLDKAGK